MTDEQDTPPRTAAATAAAMRRAEDRRAAELRERGWTCIPPDTDRGELCAVIRDVPGERSARVIVAPAGVPPTAIDVLRLTGPMPRPTGRSEQQRRQLAPTADELAGHGYVVERGWTFGVDARGPYASCPVRWVGV